MLGRFPTLPPDVVGALIAESVRLESSMERLQEEPPPTAADLEACRSSYRQWLSSSRRLLSGEALDKLMAEDKGSFWTAGISRFLASPREESPLKDEVGRPLLNRWQHSFSDVRVRLERQRQLLNDNASVDDPMLSVIEPLVAMFRRFPDFWRTLATGVQVHTIKDEKQLQVLVEAVLRLVFDDVRAEDYVPSRGGGNSRVDFVLPEEGVVIETKMTRASLTANKLGEELLIDAGRYPRHPDCRAILAFVYDPERRLVNPRGLERDLTVTTGTGQRFTCVIVS